MVIMEGAPKKLSMKLLNSTRPLGEQLNWPASWTLWLWSPLTTPTSLRLEGTHPGETLFLVMYKSKLCSFKSCIKTMASNVSNVVEQIISCALQGCLTKELKTVRTSLQLCMEMAQDSRLPMEVARMWMQEFHVRERWVLKKLMLCASSLLWRNRIITTET